MGVETAIIVGGLQLAKTVSEYNQAKSDARATAREGAIAMDNRKKEIQMLAARQKINYLNSGVELEGTAQAVMQDTYNTGIEDLNAIQSSYNQTIKNKMTQARANLLGGIASSAVSAYTMGGFGSGIENMAGQSASWNPATSAPSMKPIYTGV